MLPVYPVQATTAHKPPELAAPSLHSHRPWSDGYGHECNRGNVDTRFAVVHAREVGQPVHRLFVRWGYDLAIRCDGNRARAYDQSASHRIPPSYYQQRLQAFVP